MKKLFKFFSLFSLVAASVIFALVCVGNRAYPDTISLSENQEINVNGIYSLQNSKKENTVFSANFVQSVSEDAEGNESYQVNISLLNTIPVKSSTVTVSKRQYVVPSGDIFGIKIFTDGILIVGMDDVPTANGIVNPAKRAGLKVGDILLAVEGQSLPQPDGRGPPRPVFQPGQDGQGGRFGQGAEHLFLREEGPLGRGQERGDWRYHPHPVRCAEKCGQVA